MTTKAGKTKKKPTWTDLKRRLNELDRNGLIGLIQDLYAAGKDNKAFLHARFGLGDDVLKPYKATISRWVCPDVFKDQGISVAKAKKAISDYRKAIGHPEGMAELTVFYCEESTTFIDLCGMDDEGYLEVLVRMFEEALEAACKVDPGLQQSFVERLEQVRQECQNYGYCVGDDMDNLMAEYGFGEE